MHALLEDIRSIIAQARERVARSVHHELTLAYWHIGHRLVEEEQQGKERADYGKRLVEDMSVHLRTEFGSGFSPQNLWFMRQFYLTFPILSAVSRELTWTHYKALVRLDDPDKRAFYIAEAVKNAWSVRQNDSLLHSVYGFLGRPLRAGLSALIASLGVGYTASIPGAERPTGLVLRWFRGIHAACTKPRLALQMRGIPQRDESCGTNDYAGMKPAELWLQLCLFNHYTQSMPTRNM